MSLRGGGRGGRAARGGGGGVFEIETEVQSSCGYQHACN